MIPTEEFYNENWSDKKKMMWRIMQARDFDFWRKNHSKLSFSDQKEISNDWTIRCQDQRCYNKDFFFSALDQIKNLEQLSILEYGPYKGYLAYDILRKYKVKSYIGYDIADVAINLTSPDVLALGYKGVALPKQLWEMTDIAEFDIFISSDTIEHLIDAEAIKLFEWIYKRATYVILIVQWKEHNMTWAGCQGSHILDLDGNDIVSMFEKNGFETKIRSSGWMFFVNKERLK